MKITILKFFLIISFCAGCFYAQAQQQLSGEVVDKNNEPIPFVTIIFSNGISYTLSDNDGRFTLEYPDTVTRRSIRLQSIGYKSKTMMINKGQEFVRAVLIDSLHSLQQVVVSASKYGRFTDYSAQTIQMSTFDIVTNPSAMADIIGNMRVLPGVQTNDNDGRLIIQGGSAEESQIYINDLIVVNPYNMSSKNSGVRTRFSSDLFSGIALQSGGYNAEFGQALSGIVNLNTKEKREMESKTDLSVSSVYAALTHIEQKSSYAYRANVSYTNLGLYNKLTTGDYDWSKPYEQISADAFFIKEFSSKTKMILQAQWSRSAGEYTYYNVDTVRHDVTMKENYFYSQLNFYHTFNKRWSLSLAGNVVANDFSGTDQQNKIHTTNIWNHNKLNIQYKNDVFTNRTGVEFICNPFDETLSNPLIFQGSFERAVKNNLWTLYNDTKISLSRNLSVSLGLRGEYSTYLKQFNFAPRAYIGYCLDKFNILSASVGEYFQLPTMDYLKLENEIDFTSATKGTLSYSYVKVGSKFQVDTYYKKYKNIVTHTEDIYFPSDVQNSGSGYGWGVDVFWKNNFKRLEYWLNYSYNDTRKQYGYFSDEVVPTYVARHSFNITLKYWWNSLKSLISAGYNISSGAPYYSDAAPYNRLGETPFRNRLDVSWSFLPRQWIVIHAACQNVMGTENIYGYEYSKTQAGVRQAVTNPDKRFFFLGVFITFSRDKNLNQLKDL